MRSQWKYIAVLLAILVAVVVYQLNTPRPIDWSRSFTRSDKIPYGGTVLYGILQDLFPEQPIDVAELPAYNALDATTRGVYVVINGEFTPDELDTKALLAFVERGNTVFIAAERFTSPFADSLRIVTEGSSPFGRDSSGINFTSPSLRTPRGYFYKEFSTGRSFSGFDSAATTVLGTDTAGRPNFIRTRHGNGAFLLSTVPLAYTNYYLVDTSTADYVFKALSYLPVAPVIWDEYYKDGRRNEDTPLQFVLNVEPLRWALFTMLIGTALFVVFMGRRRQRIIPIIKPLPNTTLEFVNTVGQLYYRHGDHSNIAGKRIAYFLEHLRTMFGVNTNERTDAMFNVLAARSGIEAAKLRALFDTIDAIQSKSRLNEADLATLSDQIEDFHASNKRGA